MSATSGRACRSSTSRIRGTGGASMASSGTSTGQRRTIPPSGSTPSSGANTPRPVTEAWPG
eukprot:237328-Alexandrium_andersonii.AAC.1